MAFVDQLTEVLRAPPGSPDRTPPAPPPDAWDRWRRVLFGALNARKPGAWTDDLIQMWSGPTTLRRRFEVLWSRTHDVLDVLVDVEGRVAIVEEVLRRHIDRRAGVAASGLVESEIVRLVAILRDRWADADWRDPVRYLTEVGALDASGTRRLPFGDLLLSLGVRDRVIALLHAESVQSTGLDDPWRYNPHVLRWLANAPTFDAEANYGEPDLARLERFGLVYLHRDGSGGVVSDRAAWLSDVIAEPVSLIGLLVRGALRDRLGEVAGQPSTSPKSSETTREFAELVSHELGNAVTPLERSISQLQEALGADNRQLRRIADVAVRLREFSRSLHVLMPSQTEEAAPFDLLGAVNDALTQTVTERNGHLRPVVALPVLTVIGPRVRFTLALVQLIRNAAQASVGGATELRITGRVEGAALELWFEDDGPGVPPSIEASLFDRGVSGRGGSGMGLALVREVVHREMGGSVRYQRRPERGAAFVIALPATAVEVP